MQKRRIKIQSKYRNNKYGLRIYPSIRLEGYWLQKAGFESNEYVEIKVLYKKLIIYRSKKT
ncbi:MAG: SymE family type I addiction module toxin [Chryseotalea sp.]|jgi:hypothetical protein